MQTIKAGATIFGLLKNRASNFNAWTSCSSWSRTSPFLTSPVDPSHLHGYEEVETILPANFMVWVDMEMTGLDVEKEQIMEIACIITDKDVNIVAEAEDLILKVDDDTLHNMHEWCQNTHGLSGLTSACRKSQVSLSEAEEKLLGFLERHVPAGCCPLAGNTVHTDKKFLDKFLPRVSNHLHYRIIDVTSISELAKRWYPKEHSAQLKKQNVHRAKGDIMESIEQLRHLRRTVFK